MAAAQMGNKVGMKFALNAVLYILIFEPQA